ncbi:MAG TPA: nickel pincer cofactor biosynthesis protein LarC [Candidatus Binatia bacterium]
MRVAYGDLIGGISGDMFVAALLDLGLSLEVLSRELRKIPTLKFELKVDKKTVGSIAATQFQVKAPRNEAPRSWKEIHQLIETSQLAHEIQETGIKIFHRLAEVEGKIHGVPTEEIHFHEVGATDSIVDIVAAAIGFHELKIGAMHFSKVPLGRGVIQSGHGPLPVPGPATLELLKGIPVQWTQLAGETVTPTGAAIMSSLGISFGEQPSMTVESIGYGAGQKEWPDRPNLFRLVLGATVDWRQEEMLVIETNIDDMNPQFFEHVMERLFAAGAGDVFFSPIQMKKNRPAVLVRIIAELHNRDRLAKILFEETTTIGLRYHSVSRIILNRTEATIKTRFGDVKIKLWQEPSGRKRISPEYDELKRIAIEKKIPLNVLRDEIVKSFKE